MSLSKEVKLPLKRKIKSSSLSARKKLKIDNGRGGSRKTVAQLGDLPWKSVARPMDTGMGGDDGILELEEVDDVEVYYEHTDAGRVAKFRVSESIEKNEAITEGKDEEPLGGGEQDNDEETETSEEQPSFDSENLLPEWHGLSLHSKLAKALHTKGFTNPTAIQKEAIPLALQGRDIVGVAQTGSGKTLAYGLPILSHLLSRKRPSSKHRRPLSALIVAPTRELALQVSEHMNAILKASEPKDEEKRSTKKAPHVSISAIVGGMSQQKQKRLLDRGVDVLIATPGRMWDMISADDDLAREIRALRFLVLDEADRMIETGHFAELDNILRLTLRESEDDKIPEDQDEASSGEANAEGTSGKRNETELQTFVFSATLSKDLQRNLRKKARPGNFSRKKKHQPTSTLDDLLLKLDFRDPEPEIVDLSPKGGVVSTLQEGRVHCLTTDKDVYLLYFLLRHPGRTLVFLGSIDGIRRLNPLMELLNVKAFPLHAQMEQRQRLKNLDRFKSTPNAVLLATDVAARGLDIPSVDHVIHFQIPRTAETYIHRNGRTARANREGFSMLMCAPDERKVVRALMYSLGREESQIPELELELGLLDKLKERVRLAKEIEKIQHKTKRGNFEKNWMKEAADALEVDLDSDFFSDDEEDRGNKKQQKVQNAKISSLKAELKRMLAQPLMASGFSAKYITSGSRPVVDDLLAGTVNSSMIGVKQIAAREEVKKVKYKKKEDTVEKITK